MRMIAVKNGAISQELFDAYLESLVGKFFKIMPMNEKNDDTLKVYLESFKVDLLGKKSLIIALNNNAYFLDLISSVQYLIDNDVDVNTCNREVKKCIGIVKKLRAKLIQGGGE